MKRILMATDGSPASNRALVAATDLAKATGAKLTLLAVMETPLLFGKPVPPAVSPTQLAEPIDDYLRQAAGALLADAADRCRKRGVDPELVVRQGHPVEEILKEARRSKADLLVMGSRGKSGIAAVLGSVAYGVLHGDSPVSVLVVRK